VRRPAGIKKTVCKGAKCGKIDIRLNIAEQLHAGAAGHKLRRTALRAAVQPL
jgi:hypothetical protein